MMKTNVYIISDTHFGHKNIFKHCPKRMEICGAKDENDIEAWDNWLIKKWNETVSKKDEVYIIGDFSFYNTETTKKILGKLNGNKYLMVGNHDKSSEHLEGYFKQIVQIKEKLFKAKVFDFLDEDFKMYFCHYPLLSWPAKNYGAIMVHGHCHGNIDKYNEDSIDLRVDVGIDGGLANYELIPLQKLYEHIRDKVRKFGETNDCSDKVKSLTDYAHYIFEGQRIGMI